MSSTEENLWKASAADKIPNISLAHYIYIPTEDYHVVKQIWSGLVQKYNLAGLNPDEVISESKGLAHASPILIRNEHLALGLFILKNLAAIEILYFADPKQAGELNKELEDIRLELKEHADCFAGESTVTVLDSPIKDNPPENLSIHEKVLNSFELGNVLIYSVAPEDELLRHYLTRPKNGGVPTDFLTSKLPAVDSLLFKLKRQALYFRDQRNFIHDKRRDFDQALSDILNKRAETGSAHEKNANPLEKDIERLSLMYGGLVSNLKLIKKARDTMAHDIEKLGSLAKKIGVGEGFNYFRDVVMGGYISLLKDLELDDKFLHRSLDDTRATIEIVRTRIDLERSRESFSLQKEGVSVQTAAGLIELFIVWFYTLEAWELLATKEVFEHIPIAARLGSDILFAGTVVAFTHYAAKLLRNEKALSGLLASGLGIIIALSLMFLTTFSATKG